MLTFKQLEITDANIIQPYLSYSPFKLCDYTLGANLMWAKFYKAEFVITNDMLIITSADKDEDNRVFSFPVGFGDLSATLDSIENYCIDKNIPLIFSSIESEYIDILKNHFSGRYSNIRVKVTFWDYLYDIESIVSLTGKKLHSKRNHINNFMALYPNYEYKTIDSNTDFTKLIDFANFLEKSQPKAEDSFYYDIMALKVFLNNYDILKFLGGYIEVSNEIVALALGEIHNQILYVHNEKALRDFQGASAVINNLFARQYKDLVKLVNREDDMGDEGLRKAKLSYKPIVQENKYDVIFQN